MLTDKSLKDKIEKIDKRLKKLEKAVFGTSTKKFSNTKRTSLAGAITILIGKGFFNSPKDLNQIIQKVKGTGAFYPKTSYPDSLLRLKKKNNLRRLKEGKKWVYVKYG